MLKHVHVQKELMEIIVLLVQLPEFGTTPMTNVFAQPPQPNGTDNNVSVPMPNMDLTVSNVPPQDIGTMTQHNVSVILPSSMTVLTVSVLNLGSYIKADVLSVKMDSNGLIINVKNVTALSKN